MRWPSRTGRRLTRSTLEQWGRPAHDPRLDVAADDLIGYLRSATGSWPFAVEVYPQGSYANGTATSYSSDVDVVVELTYPPLEAALLYDAIARHDRYRMHQLAGYWLALRRHVGLVLPARYGAVCVGDGRRAFRVTDVAGTGITADVLVAQTLHDNHHSQLESSETDGFVFWRRPDMWADTLEPHPALGASIGDARTHRLKIEEKDQRTGLMYRPMIRATKIACRTFGAATPATASSFDIESLLFNVPDRLFAQDPLRAFRQMTQWLADECPINPVGQASYAALKMPCGYYNLTRTTRNPFHEWVISGRCHAVVQNLYTLAH